MAPGNGSDVQAVAEEALGIDRVEAELLTQLLAQFADVAFDHVLFDLVVENAIDGVENLGFGDTAPIVGGEELEDTAFATRQG